MTDPPRILVAGIGNIFLGDDAFGVRVAEALLRRSLPAGVHVVDFGIRGLDLAYALLDPWHAVILIDAAPRGHAPGTLSVIEPEIDPGDASRQGVPMQGHSMDPASVLQLVHALGGQPPPIVIVACEPTPIDFDGDIQMELTPPVRAAIEVAVAKVEALIAELTASHHRKETSDVLASRS